MKKTKIDLDEIHKVAIKRYAASQQAERDERSKCLEDMQFVFVPGSQWDTLESANRKDRPRFEINKIRTPVNQVIGDERNNSISMKVRAAKGAASKEVADLFSGLIRNIENVSHFKDVKDTAFKEIVSGGFGAWAVTTSYSDEDSFDQEITIKAIKSAASSVFYDTAAQDELKRDAMWIMVTEDMDKELFRSKWPDKSMSDLTIQNTILSDWQSRDTVRIADYWLKVPIIKELAQMSDGSIIELNEKNKTVLDELQQQGVTVTKTRRKHCYKIVMYKISAGTVLEGPMEWAGSTIPVVPIFGYNVWINGNHYYQGMVRSAKDAQRVYNYATSQMIEVSALSPKDPYWVTAKQMKGNEASYINFNVTNSPFMTYTPDAAAPGIPARSGAPTLQQALVQQVQQADQDVQSVTGLYNPSLGQETGSEKSGRAILALQKQGNAATYELSDNLRKAVEYTGQILVDLIPKIYDTERQVSILDEVGASSPITINKTVTDTQTGQQVIVADLSKGKYSVVSASGPSYATQRTEGLNFLAKLSESNPMFAKVATDLMAQSVDFPFAEELTKRIRRSMINEGIVMPDEDELKELQENQKQPTAVEQLNFKILQFQAEQQAAIVDNLETQNRKLQADIAHKYSQAQKQLTDVIETKADINKKLDELGNPIDMPIEEGEIIARSAVLRELNETLELTQEDVAQMQNNPVQPEIVNPELIQDNNNIDLPDE